MNKRDKDREEEKRSRKDSLPRFKKNLHKDAEKRLVQENFYKESMRAYC